MPGGAVPPGALPPSRPSYPSPGPRAAGSTHPRAPRRGAAVLKRGRFSAETQQRWAPFSPPGRSRRHRMTAELLTRHGSPPRGPVRTSASARLIRSGGLRGIVGPTVALSYLLATWPRPHRPVMVLVAVTMIAIDGYAWIDAARIAGSSWRVRFQVICTLANLTGSGLLTFLDGGIAGPLGATIPFSVLFLAVMVPPRVFAGLGVLSAAAYWAIALYGGPSPPGYATPYTLGIAGVGWLSLRHAGALASLRRRLVSVSRIDPLTHCLNRRGFDERLEQELDQAVRTGNPITLVLADLDGFKQVNDAHGHQA